MCKENSNKTKICNCEIRKTRKEEGINYSSHVVEFDENNKIAIELRDVKLIRISEVITSNEEACLNILAVVLLIALKNRYETIYFAGKMSDSRVRWFKKAGFIQTYDKSFNHEVYLDFKLKK